jgi:flagellin
VQKGGSIDAAISTLSRRKIMSLSINTNVASLIAHQNMYSNDSEMTSSLQRLSTGLRINTAADDAAGMTIADSLESQYLGIGQGIKNANEGVSILQTADGALEESVNIVNTIKTKAIQAASDSQTSDTRAALQEDIDKLMEELDTIASTTTYNGQQLLNGSFTNKTIQTGSTPDDSSNISIGSASANDTGHLSTATLSLDDEEGSDVKLTITSAITGEEVELAQIAIENNGKEENGMGALADEINSVTYLTGISATAVVESTTNESIQEGTTGKDFAINGVVIGAINVEDNDSNSALVTAINDKTTQTGVSAAINDDGTLQLTSEDGRSITVAGDGGDVFGTQDVEELSTIGYISLTQEGSSQFNIEATTADGTGDAITLNDDFTATDTTTLADESTIASGSVLSAGTVLGGKATVNEVADTKGDFKLEAGSQLASGSVIAQGTKISGEVSVDGNTDLKEDMTVTSGSTLATGSVIGKGTVLTSSFTSGSQTYEAGATLTADVTLDSALVVSEDLTLSDDSTIADESTLASDTVLGADITTSGTSTMADDMTLEDGSTIASGSTMTAGSTLGDSTTLQTSLEATEDMELAAGSTLASGSVVAEDSEIEGKVTISTVTLTDEMTLGAGSTIASGSTLKAGTQVNQDMVLETSGGTEIQVSAGSTITEDMTLSDDVVLSEEMTLETGSSILSGSQLVVDTDNGDVSLTNQENLTLSDLSVLTQEDATIAIKIAEAALADLDSTRSSIGSVQNQLESSVANMSTTKTNVQSSESTIRDVDFAEETSTYSKLSLLAQTSSYALAQANASTSNITSLLQ